MIVEPKSVVVLIEDNAKLVVEVISEWNIDDSDKPTSVEVVVVESMREELAEIEFVVGVWADVDVKDEDITENSPDVGEFSEVLSVELGLKPVAIVTG